MRDYGTIMRCRKCRWRGPFYLMLVPTTYPGAPSCPNCGKGDPVIEEAYEQNTRDSGGTTALAGAGDGNKPLSPPAPKSRS